MGNLSQSNKNFLGQMARHGYIACGDGVGASKETGEKLSRLGLAMLGSTLCGTRYYIITDAGRAALEKTP
jgi:hypothetical protein